jgi:quercetin dioxygenase-like cupin family protein
MQKIELTKISGKDDPRGEIFNLSLPAKGVINIQTTKKGYGRGGHSHSYNETFLVITGKVEYHTGIISKERIITFGPGSVIQTTPKEPHYLVAKKFSVLIEIRPSGTKYKAKNYEPYRSRVLKLMDGY